MGNDDTLRDELLKRFTAGADSIRSDDEFNDLALKVFAHNFSAVPAYRAYCLARGRDPSAVDHWTGIPAVPTAAFREVALHDRNATIDRVFRTSGTTEGRERRGEHHVADLELYRTSLRASFEWYVLPDGIRPRAVSLMPPAASLPDSSLAFMITDVIHALGGPGSAAYADTDGLDRESLRQALRAAASAGVPVLLLGTSAALVHWLDGLAASDQTFELPPGSRLMDTGGYKGKGREWEPSRLRAAYTERPGIPGWACVNEYGMTELLSQYYDVGLRDRLVKDDSPARAENGAAGEATPEDATDVTRRAPPRGAVRKRGPGWLRSVAVDPETLSPLPAGETGLLRHVDLANLYGIAAVQTEDLGYVVGREVVVVGRAAGAPARGCSIAMDMFLGAGP